MIIKNSWYAQHLACPDCKNNLSIDSNIYCKACGFSQHIKSKDLKPKTPEPLSINFQRLNKIHPQTALRDINTTSPTITYKGPSAIRDSSELISQINDSLSAGDKVLDLGCGPRDQWTPINYLGYKYVGVDYSNENADLLADAHAIPFKDSTFDCVLSYAVLEHLHNPFIAVHEIERVLKPTGIYIGTVSQGEPFHGSYFHHTSWGLISLISTIPNLELVRIWSSSDTLYSISIMGRYPRIIKKIIGIVDLLHKYLPILAPRKMKWLEKDKKIDQLHRAGSICFVVKKCAQ